MFHVLYVQYKQMERKKNCHYDTVHAAGTQKKPLSPAHMMIIVMLVKFEDLN